MAYIAESIPGPFADALPAYAATLPGSAAVFSEKDLAVATDEGKRRYFSLAGRGASAETVAPADFRTAIEGDRVVPARFPTGDALKQLQVVPGMVARSIVLAMTEHRRAGRSGPSGNVGWRVQDQMVVVLVAPKRETADSAAIGGATSAGKEVHYHVDTTTFTIVRTTFAR
jgi:hypothetical protein